MREIPLTQGKVALVDDEDYEWLSQWKWFAYHDRSGTWYARRNIRLPDGRMGILSMQNAVRAMDAGYLCDHEDGDGLNNQRYNLRRATKNQNVRNRKKQRNNTSGYRGVSWDAEKQKWRAQIRVDTKGISLGRFSDPEDAARAYNAAALKHFGEFARLNEVP
jgi:hypothetical protein